MDAQQQRLEIEPVLAHDDDLAVHHAARGQRGGERGDELGEVAIHRLRIPALQQDLVAVPEYQRAKAVPLGLELPARAAGQGLRRGGEHRLDRRRERQRHETDSRRLGLRTLASVHRC
jgi:hypothetical protein